MRKITPYKVFESKHRQFLNENREKITLGGNDMWLDRTGYPAIWLYDSENSQHGIPVDVLYDGKLIGSSDLNDIEKKELLRYLNSKKILTKYEKNS